MTDEEKKSIEIIKYLQYKCIDENETGMMPIYRLDDLANAIKILLNLIEKQQKEIEELKEDSCCMTNCVRRDKEKLFLEDKIKAKIEEYKEKCKNCNFKGEICKEFTKNYNCVIAACLNEFYSLLEKE